MAKRRMNRAGRSEGTSRYVRLFHWVLDSPAYISLSPTARALLIELYKKYNSFNNGRVYLSVRNAAERLGVCKDTPRKAFAELEDRGFIRATTRGNFHWKTRQATEWILTEFEYDNKLPTKEFARWGAEAVEDSEVGPTP